MISTTMTEKHSFCVAAYGESPYLRECLQSISAQTLRSQVLLCTSTPNLYLENLAKDFGARYVVGTHRPGIGRDWNAAFRAADTPYVTIAHQDDIYHSDYVKQVMAAAEGRDDLLFLFTDYTQLIKGVAYAWRPVVLIKRLLVFPFWFFPYIRSPFFRRLIFMFGNPVSCPGVLLNKKRLPKHFAFNEEMKTNLDWAAWHELAKLPGGFYRVPCKLVQHRVHSDSATSHTIQNEARMREDIFMFEQIWGRRIAKIIMLFYRLSYWLNRVSTG